MPSKKVVIKFVHYGIKASEHIADITEAVKWTAPNVEKKSGITLHNPVVANNGDVILSMDVPNEMAYNFNVGCRLRGIGVYLATRCSFPYRKYFVGSRLIKYAELDDATIKYAESDDATIKYAESDDATPPSNPSERWIPIYTSPDGTEFFLVERFNAKSDEREQK